MSTVPVGGQNCAQVIDIVCPAEHSGSTVRLRSCTRKDCGGGGGACSDASGAVRFAGGYPRRDDGRRCGAVAAERCTVRCFSALLCRPWWLPCHVILFIGACFLFSSRLLIFLAWVFRVQLGFVGRSALFCQNFSVRTHAFPLCRRSLTSPAALFLLTFTGTALVQYCRSLITRKSRVATSAVLR